MPGGQVGTVLRHLRGLLRARTPGEESDGRLIENFLRLRDEAAFAEIVRRHGPLVLGVCRRVLGDAHDAEDAFQATFLVLVRKGGSVRKRQSLASWLYGVAYRTALKAHGRAARRRALERQAATMPIQPQAHDGAASDFRELRPILDEELSRLPQKYRAPLLLCYLEGKTKEEAARELVLPAGTVSSRLARGRELLRRRLARRGVTLPAAGVAAMLAESTASAAVPTPLLSATVQAAVVYAAGKSLAAGAISAPVAALTEGVLHTMFLSKVKTATVMLLALSVAALGGGMFGYRTFAGGPDEAKAANPASNAAAQQKPAPDEPPPFFRGAFDDFNKTLEAQQLREAVTQLQAQVDALRKQVDDLKKQLGPARGLGGSGPADAAVLSLLKERRDTARDAFRLREQEFEAGRAAFDEFFQWSQLWLDAELALASKKEERIAHVERHVEIMKKAEEIAKVRLEVGRIPGTDYLATKYHRLEAELWLAREKGK